MNIVRDRADTRWAPARYNLAIFRLAVLAIGSRLTPVPEPGIVLAIDRNQNRVETYVMSIWVVTSLSAYAASVLALLIGPAGAAIVAVPLAITFCQVAIVLSGLVLVPLARLVVRSDSADNTELNSALLMGSFALLSLWIASTKLWSRYVGMLFIALLVVNALAAIAVRLMSRKIAEANRARGVGA